MTAPRSDEVRVDAVRASAYEVPTDAPESDGTLAWDSTVIVVVEVEGAGLTGLGYTYAHQSAATLVSAKLADVVTGMNALDVRAAWAEMLAAVRNLGTTGIVAMAVSAVDVALWDLKARLLEVPLVTLVDAAHDAVPVYGSGGFTSYDDERLARQLADWVEQGIPRVKIKVGRDPEHDRHRLTVARKAVGDDVELYADANGAYTVEAAIDWAQLVRGEFGVTWLEEPVSSDDVAGLAAVRARRPGGLTIAAGEYGWAPWLLRPLLAAGAVDCLQVDVTRCLGITGFLDAAALAEAYATDVSAHCAPQVSAHACVGVRRLRHLEYFHDHTRIESMLFDGVLPVEPGGMLRPDRSRQGHGLTLRSDDAERFRVG